MKVRDSRPRGPLSCVCCSSVLGTVIVVRLMGPGARTEREETESDPSPALPLCALSPQPWTVPASSYI